MEYEEPRIMNAYTDKSCWLKYYNMVNDLFADPVDTAQKAKTYSVIAVCLQFRENDGTSHERIYKLLKRYTQELSLMKLSAELNLDTFEDYLKSTHAISVSLMVLNKS
jgi:hypothetical protein